jgi:hypothetical protein
MGPTTCLGYLGLGCEGPRALADAAREPLKHWTSIVKNPDFEATG